MTNIHLLADEKLGGVQREYIEVERNAEVGDYVHITKFEGIDVSEIRRIEKHCFGDTYDLTEAIREECCLAKNMGDVFTVLEPTDIVVIDDQRFRLVERKAEVGEKVLIVDNTSEHNGRIGEIVYAYDDGGASVNVDADWNYYPYVFRGTYRVLIPVKSETKTKIYTCDNCGTKLGDIACSNSKGGAYCSVSCADADELVTVDETQCSEAVLDMLANLARRVTELEKLAGMQRNENRLAHDRIEEVNDKAEMCIRDIALLDERTIELVEPKQAAEHLLRKIAKLIEEGGGGV